MRKLLGVALLAPMISVSVAQVAPVEELGAGVPGNRSVSAGRAPQGSSQAASSQAASEAAVPARNQALVDLHFEVQSLRDEVRELRGLVDEQANELRQLRQRQLDDYQDLDRRISAASGGGSSVASTRRDTGGLGSTPAPGDPAMDDDAVFDDGGSAPAATGSTPGSSAANAGNSGDYEAYITNYNLIKARKIDEAVAGFTTFVAKFPNSPYTANAYYWLGEIYLLQNNLQEAGKAFATVTDKFPAHRKAPDAKFKLGKVYHLQGDNNRARALLNDVAATNSSAAALAKAYLNDNF